MENRSDYIKDINAIYIPLYLLNANRISFQEVMIKKLLFGNSIVEKKLDKLLTIKLGLEIS